MEIDLTSLIKDNALVCNIVKNGTVNEVSLKSGTKLGQVFYSLPHGIINKTVTGIGATTLELESLRNSIIVEPLKITASSKVYKHTKKGKECLYVGSMTAFHASKTTDKQIEKYVTNTTIKYKKIVVVADSLWRVINLLESNGIDVYKEYFLLIDEIDSFQMDSTYRSSLETCIDYYKLFDEKMRAMTTATILSFSDPQFKELEATTVFQYEVPEIKEIQLVKTDTIQGCCYEIIKVIAVENNKIVVAYNSVTDTYNIAEFLVKNGIFKKDEIAILAGANSENKRRLKSYFHELSSETFPKQLNFITSAYFTGYDIKEPYHLLSVSAGMLDYKRLSVNSVIQIMGRNRIKKGLLSNILLFSLSNGVKREVGEEGFISQAETELQIVKCTESNYEANPLMMNRLLEFRKQLQTGKKSDNYQYVRRNLSNENTFSYLNIDAASENEKVFNMYRKVDSVKEAFEEAGFNYKDGECNSTEIIEVVIDSKVNNEESIRNFVNIVKHNAFNINSTSYDIEQLNPFEIDLITTFQDYQYIVKPESLLDVIVKKAVTQSNFNKLKRALSFHKIDKKDPFPTFLMQEFQINEKYFYEEICDKAQEVMIKSSNPDCFMGKNRKQINAHMSAYLEYASSSKDNPITGEKNVTCRKIIGYNPLKLDLINH